MLAIRTHLYILGETKACSNSSNDFFPGEVQKRIHNTVFPRKLLVFFFVCLFITYYSRQYIVLVIINVCWNKTALRAILTRLIMILAININICTIDGRQNTKCRSAVQFSTNTQGFFLTSGLPFLCLNKM